MAHGQCNGTPMVTFLDSEHHQSFVVSSYTARWKTKVWVSGLLSAVFSGESHKAGTCWLQVSKWTQLTRLTEASRASSVENRRLGIQCETVPPSSASVETGILGKYCKTPTFSYTASADMSEAVKMTTTVMEMIKNVTFKVLFNVWLRKNKTMGEKWREH